MTNNPQPASQPSPMDSNCDVEQYGLAPRRPAHALRWRFTDEYLPDVDALRRAFDRPEDQPSTYAENADLGGRSLFLNIWDESRLIATDRLTLVRHGQRSVIETWSAGTFTIPERGTGTEHTVAEGSRAVVDTAYGNSGIYTYLSAALCMLAHAMGVRVVYTPMERACPGLTPLRRMGFERFGNPFQTHGLPGRARVALVYRIDLDESLGRCRDELIHSRTRMREKGLMIRGTHSDCFN